MEEKNKVDNLNLKVTNEEGQPIEIRIGEALPLHEPRFLLIVGLITNPAIFIEKREEQIDPKKSHIIVTRDDMRIGLRINEHEYYNDQIVGELTLNPDFVKFGINNPGKTYTTFELANFIKMNRSFFEKKDVAMKLVSELMNFKAKVDKEIENSDDNRGARKILLNQVVDSNIPESFVLEMPIFSGQEKEKFDVEIGIASDDFTCSLISPDVADHIRNIRDLIIDDELKKIRVLLPDLPILEA